MRGLALFALMSVGCFSPAASEQDDARVAIDATRDSAGAIDAPTGNPPDAPAGAPDARPDASPDQYNRLNGAFTGGAARVVAITAFGDGWVEQPNRVYRTDLEVGCSSPWHPQGPLCDDPRAEASTRHSKTEHAALTFSGATWNNVAPAITGVLIIDACATGACATIEFDEARVFQMFSDGKTTHVALAVHDETGPTPPAWNDLGWFVVASSDIAAGTDSGAVITGPTVMSLPSPRTTRYLRVEAQNDGRHGFGSYIELRALKLFGPP